MTVTPSIIDTPEALKAAKLVELCLGNIIDFNDSLRHLLFAKYTGQSFAEIQWAVTTMSDGTQITKPQKLKTVNSKKWRIVLVPDKKQKGLAGEFKFVLYDYGRFMSKEHPGVDVDKVYPGRFIKHSPDKLISIHKRGAFRATSFFFFYKKAMEAFRNNGAEKYAFPILYANVPSDITPEAQLSILNGLGRLSQNTNALFEDDVTVNTIDSNTTQGAAQMFTDAITEFNKAISVAILGQSMTTDQGDAGSRAMGEVHERVKMDGSMVEAVSLAATLEQQLIRPILERNLELFGGIMPPLPRLSFDVAQRVAPILPQHYTMVKKNEIREQLNLPLLSLEEGGDDWASAEPRQNTTEQNEIRQLPTDNNAPENDNDD